MAHAPRTATGFTLLEVLVAVAVLAIALGAIIAAGSQYANDASYLRDKTLALWVAHNRLTEIELQPQWPDIGQSNDQVQMGGVQWKWRAAVVETPDENLRRVDVRVEKVGDTRKPPSNYASLTGFVGRPRQAGTP